MTTLLAELLEWVGPWQGELSCESNDLQKRCRVGMPFDIPYDSIAHLQLPYNDSVCQTAFFHESEAVV